MDCDPPSGGGGHIRNPCISDIYIVIVIHNSNGYEGTDEMILGSGVTAARGTVLKGRSIGKGENHRSDGRNCQGDKYHRNAHTQERQPGFNHVLKTHGPGEERNLWWMETLHHRTRRPAQRNPGSEKGTDSISTVTSADNNHAWQITGPQISLMVIFG